MVFKIAFAIFIIRNIVKNKMHLNFNNNFVKSVSKIIQNISILRVVKNGINLIKYIFYIIEVLKNRINKPALIM